MTAMLSVHPLDTDALLNAALDYHKRGWPIIPMKGDKPAVTWRTFLYGNPNEDKLQAVFSRPGVTGVAVGLGEWSRNLACRGFNSADAYNRWADADPDFAKRFPTVKTGCGFDVFFRSGLHDAKKFDDGEYLCTDYKYRLLPPSLCDGTLYEWFVEAPGPLPLIEDPNKAGLLATLQPSASNGACVMQEARRLAEELAAEITPESPSHICYAPFWLARKIRTIADDRPERFRDAVQHFCELTGFDFDDVWYSFLKVFPEIKVPEGQDAFSAAAKLAVDKDGCPSLRVQKYVEDVRLNLVASLAYYLSGVREDGVVFLPRERVAKWLGTRRLVTVSHIVALLVQEGILQPLHDGAYSYKEGHCKEYKFVGSVQGVQVMARKAAAS